MSDLPKIEIIVPEDELMAKIDELAERLAPRLAGDWTIVSILIGATPFTADLMKALARRDVHPMLDVIWLESYHDARESSGRVAVRADLSRPVKDRGVLLLDDVFDTGRTLDFAKHHLIAKGAREVITCALTQKPWAPRGEMGVDFCAIDAPGRYLVGYGMDDAGKYRGLPYIGALD
ncbi:MAG: hypoxanthine phosphoribosyltransferase [Hyphomonas sp.]|nr:hypoxanthine phosphoribosyltransferase [Hyphomonas sp.]